jgi:uncharacterized protein with FMN-binding domain
MKRITFWLMSTLTALVLLFGYHTSTSSTAAAQGGDSSAIAPVTGSTATAGGTTTDGTTTDGTGTASGTGGAASSSAAASSAAPSTSSGGSTTSGAVTGSVAQTRWGPVQVKLTVSSGRITDVSVLQYPNGNGRDQEINARALPVLIQETLKAQSASIDMVSGATVTSDGYLTSLQSALDKAGL